MAWTYDYNKTTPPDTGESPRLGASRIRELKNALQERLNVCVYYPYTGNEVSDTCAGEIRRLLFHEPIETTPTVAASHGDLRLKDFDGKAELTWTDEDEHEVQLTSGGYLNGAVLLANSVDEDAVRLSNDSYLTGRNNADDGDVNIFKVNTSDGLTLGAVTTLPDTSKLATSGAPAADEQIANKKYVDDQIAAIPDTSLSAYTNEDSESNAMLKAHAYKAATDGFVSVVCTMGVKQNIRGYVGNTNDPAGAGDMVDASGTGDGGNNIAGMFFAVANDEYFEVTASNGTPAIRWKSIGTLSKPVDQD